MPVRSVYVRGAALRVLAPLCTPCRPPRPCCCRADPVAPTRGRGPGACRPGTTGSRVACCTGPQARGVRNGPTREPPWSLSLARSLARSLPRRSGERLTSSARDLRDQARRLPRLGNAPGGAGTRGAERVQPHFTSGSDRQPTAHLTQKRSALQQRSFIRVSA